MIRSYGHTQVLTNNYGMEVAFLCACVMILKMVPGVCLFLFGIVLDHTFILLWKRKVRLTANRLISESQTDDKRVLILAH